MPTACRNGWRTAFIIQLVVNAKPRAREAIEPAKHAEAAAGSHEVALGFTRLSFTNRTYAPLYKRGVKVP
jgi:hypothetical protein